MYSIGIISTEVGLERPYTDILDKLNFQIQLIHVESTEDNYEDLDALIVDERVNPNAGDCYEIILKVRSQFEGFLLVLTKNKQKTTDLVYLQLGVDGIAREDVDYEVTFIQLKRFLDLIKKSTFVKPMKKSISNSTDSLKLNSQNISVIKNENEEVELTNKEYQLLTFLMTNAGSTLSYRELYQKIWHIDEHLDKDY